MGYNRYSKKLYVWEVDDDGEQLLTTVNNIEEAVEYAKKSRYKYNLFNDYVFGCLILAQSNISHLEVRFEDTPRYSDRQTEFFKKG